MRKVSVGMLSAGFLVASGMLLVANAAEPRPNALIAEWQKHNQKCRGSWAGKATERACDAREQIYVAIEELGWCQPGEYTPAENIWERCKQSSYRTKNTHPKKFYTD